MDDDLSVPAADNDLDELGYLLRHEDAIRSYELAHA